MILLEGQIPNPIGGTVSYQHVCILWDQLPLGSDLRAALEIERPIVEPGLPGTAVELDTVDDHIQILEVNAIGQELLAGFLVLFKAEVMVAGNHDLVGVGQGTQEVIELFDVIQSAVPGEVAGVDEDVAFGDFERSVESVGVCNSDEFHKKVP